MAQIDVWYEGALSTRSVHSDNGAEVRTDAPKDNQGLGQAFSPTDLFAVSLASCMLTLMGMAANRLHIDIKGMHAKVTKEMTAVPVRRIGKLSIAFSLPKRPSEDEIAKLIQAAESCPVHKSLHPDIVLDIRYEWGND